MAEELLKRGTIPGSDTGDTGLALGYIPVSTLMLDAAATKYLINAAVTGGWKAGGSLDADELVPGLLTSDNDGKVYNLNEDFTTTDDFVDGAGKVYMAGTNVAVINTASAGETAVYKFDVLGGTDQSVVRQINLVNGDQALLPTNSVVTVPAALSAAYGVVKLDGGIESTYGVGDGYAATPKAVADALLSAKAYADSLDSTYELSGALDGDTFVATMTKKDHTGNVLTSFTATVPAALSSAAGLVKLSDGITLSTLNTSRATAATPKAVYDAVEAAKSYTNSKIEALDYTATGLGAGKTITSLTETDGVLSAEASDIAITESQVTNIYQGLVAAVNGLSAERPTTVNATIDLLMNLIGALSALYTPPAP